MKIYPLCCPSLVPSAQKPWGALATRLGSSLNPIRLRFGKGRTAQRGHRPELVLALRCKDRQGSRIWGRWATEELHPTGGGGWQGKVG